VIGLAKEEFCLNPWTALASNPLNSQFFCSGNSKGDLAIWNLDSLLGLNEQGERQQ
jgi:hypothetical protein